jgi:hypothetical protein
MCIPEICTIYHPKTLGNEDLDTENVDLAMVLPQTKAPYFKHLYIAKTIAKPK